MKIHIEYCIKWNYEPEFDRVSNIISNLVPDAIIQSNKSYPRSGAFEISIENKLVYSKFETNSFPLKEDIQKWFKK